MGEAIKAASRYAKTDVDYIQNDETVVTYYGWICQKMDESVFCVEYGFDYEDNSKETGYNLYCFEVTCNGRGYNVTAITGNIVDIRLVSIA